MIQDLGQFVKFYQNILKHNRAINTVMIKNSIEELGYIPYKF